MNIYDIKRNVAGNSPHFFSRDTLKFFGQTMRDFEVETIGERVFVYAPSYWDGRLMGYTFREYKDHGLHHVRDESGSLLKFSTWSDVERFFELVKEEENA